MLPSNKYRTPKVRPTSFALFASGFAATTEEWEATTIPWIFDSFVVISSVMPSLKYEPSGSALRFCSGSTAIEGLTFTTVELGVERPRNHVTPPRTSSKTAAAAPAHTSQRFG